MKRASATAGIASLLTGLAMVTSGVPAHAMFMYLNQSSLTPAASTTRTNAKVAATSHAGSAESLEVQDRKDAQGAADEVAAMVSAGLAHSEMQQSSSGEFGGASYRAMLSPFDHWWSPRSGTVMADMLYRYRSAGGELHQQVSSPGSTAAGVGAMTPPAADLIDRITSPVVDAVSPANPALPDWVTSPPAVNQPIGNIDLDDPDLIGTPTQSVPDPATIGLLGVGLLLTFIANARRNRGRYKTQMKAAHLT